MNDARRTLLKSLYLQVLVAVVLGVIFGWLWPTLGVSLKPLGDAFIKLVKMIITPVIFLTVVTGVAGMRDLGTLGRIAAKALGYFIFVSTLALAVGLIAATLVHPGAGLNVNPATLDTSKVAGYVSQAKQTSVTAFLLNIIPDTMFSALTSGEILQVLLVSILFGIALAMLGDRGDRLKDALRTLTAVVFRIVRILMYLAPVGAFGAMAFTIGQYGIGTLVNLFELVITFYATSLAFVLVVLGTIARLAGFSILSLIRYIKDELLLVLGTSSSESAMPLLMEKLEAAGVPKSIVGLVIPAGYSFNLDGTNIYMSLAALFIAQATNIHLTFGQEMVLMAVAILSSKGAAGVTGSGFIVLAATLSVVPAIPVAGMALILGVDRFMSECRSLTNIVGNAVATIVVARWEKALDIEEFRRALLSSGREPSLSESDRLQLRQG